MERQTIHPTTHRSWKSLIGYGYTYVSNLVFSSLNMGDRQNGQTWDGNKKRKREPTDEQPTAIYSRIVPDLGGSRNKNNINFKTVSASSTSKRHCQRMNETETTPIVDLHQSNDRYVFPPSPSSSARMFSSTDSTTSNSILQMEQQHLKHMTDTLKIKMTDSDSKKMDIAPRSTKLSPTKINMHQESMFLHQPIKIKTEPQSFTNIKKEHSATESKKLVTVARSSPSIIGPSPLESKSLHQGLLKRRKVLLDHPLPPGFALKHVDTSIKNTMDVIVGQIPHVKLRRTDTICGPDGQRKPNPFWKEIYDNGKRRSRPL